MQATIRSLQIAYCEANLSGEWHDNRKDRAARRDARVAPAQPGLGDRMAMAYRASMRRLDVIDGPWLLPHALVGRGPTREESAARLARPDTDLFLPSLREHGLVGLLVEAVPHAVAELSCRKGFSLLTAAALLGATVGRVAVQALRLAVAFIAEALATSASLVWALATGIASTFARSLPDDNGRGGGGGVAYLARLHAAQRFDFPAQAHVPNEPERPAERREAIEVVQRPWARAEDLHGPRYVDEERQAAERAHRAANVARAADRLRDRGELPPGPPRLQGLGPAPYGNNPREWDLLRGEPRADEARRRAVDRIFDHADYRPRRPIGARVPAYGAPARHAGDHAWQPRVADWQDEERRFAAHPIAPGRAQDALHEALDAPRPRTVSSGYAFIRAGLPRLGNVGSDDEAGRVADGLVAELAARCAHDANDENFRGGLRLLQDFMDVTHDTPYWRPTPDHEAQRFVRQNLGALGQAERPEPARAQELAHALAVAIRQNFATEPSNKPVTAALAFLQAHMASAYPDLAWRL